MTMGRSVSESGVSSTHAGFRPKPDDGVYTSGLGAPRTRSAGRPTRSWQRQRASSRWRCTPSLSSSMPFPTSPPCTNCMLASTVNTHPARCSAPVPALAPSGEGGHWVCAALPPRVSEPKVAHSTGPVLPSRPHRSSPATRAYEPVCVYELRTHSRSCASTATSRCAWTAATDPNPRSRPSVPPPPRSSACSRRAYEPPEVHYA